MACVVPILVLFSLTWLILGSVWIYRYDEVRLLFVSLPCSGGNLLGAQCHLTQGANYINCDKTLYLFVFWVITVEWGVLGYARAHTRMHPDAVTASRRFLPLTQPLRVDVPLHRLHDQQ